MGLAKLTISPEQSRDIEVMFNPNTYTISKPVVWLGSGGGAAADIGANAPTLAFGGGGSRELVLELFFDVTESAAPDKDVRAETDFIVKLTRIMRDKKKPRPPVCTINWGGGAPREDFPFKGVVSNLEQRFMLFHASGRPLRAILTVTFLEFLNRTDDQLKTDPELTTHTVRLGDRNRLDNIAHATMGKAHAWRTIAAANPHLHNPLDVPAGTLLVVPKEG